MKPTALHIERWLNDVEARLVPPQRRVLQVIVYDAGRDKEKALAKFPDIADKYTDDLATAQAKILAEHIAAHPEDAGRTVADFRWVVRTIVLTPQDQLIEPVAKDTDEDAAVSKGDAAVSETDLNVLSTTPDPGCLVRSKPWRPVHQRPARDMRRPTWKKWER
jgi:hypothetical protein